jgi:membrane protease YdiL (CAAX protease family)
MVANYDKPNNDWQCIPIFAVLFFQLAALICRSFIEMQLKNNGFDSRLATDLSYLVVPTLLLVLLFPIARQHGNLIKDLYGFRDLRWRHVFAGIALAFALWLAQTASLLIASAQDVAVVGSAPIVGQLQPSWTCGSYLNIVIGIATMAILVPPIEEAINRGFVLHYFLRRGRLLAVLSSAAIFSLFHKPEVMFMTFIAGIFFAYLTLNTASLWSATIAHSVHNLIVQFDVSCLFFNWTSLPTESGVARLSNVAVGTTMMLLGAGAVLVSSKIARAP